MRLVKGEKRRGLGLRNRHDIFGQSIQIEDVTGEAQDEDLGAEIKLNNSIHLDLIMPFTILKIA